MRTKDEIIQKADELEATILGLRKKNLNEAHDLALNFALRLTSTSRVIVLLTGAGAAREAHTICRLLFEHFFNVNALLSNEEHRDLLLQHSTAEPGRQVKRIVQENEKIATLTPEKLQEGTEFLSHPDRENETKVKLNWEKISQLGDSAGLYTAYKLYSFLYAHSTLMSIIKEISQKDIAELHENVWVVLEISRLQLREKLLTTNQTEK